MQNKKKIAIIYAVAAVLIAVLVISASVTATLFDRPAYKRFQEKTGLPGAVGISEEELLENYSALIDYNSIFFTGPLAFPTFQMSEAGRIHFEEVKAIFSYFQIMSIVSALLLALCCLILLIRRQSIAYLLRAGGILSLVIPAVVVLVMAAVGWDRFFVIFHEVFFNNDFWVFDAQTDPVILILPDSFFLNCLVRIVVCIVVSAVLLIWGGNPKTFEIYYKILKKKS